VTGAGQSGSQFVGDATAAVFFFRDFLFVAKVAIIPTKKI
jgi:hypothetical protein